MKAILIFPLAAVLGAGVALAQSDPAKTAPQGNPAIKSPTPNSDQPNMTSPSATTPPSTTATTPPGTTGSTKSDVPVPTNAKLEPGSNSFTEAQARSRMEGAGISNLTEFQKDDQGIWRGKGQMGGKSVSVGLDFKGNISAQ